MGSLIESLLLGGSQSSFKSVADRRDRVTTGEGSSHLASHTDLDDENIEVDSDVNNEEMNEEDDWPVSNGDTIVKLKAKAKPKSYMNPKGKQMPKTATKAVGSIKARGSIATDLGNRTGGEVIGFQHDDSTSSNGKGKGKGKSISDNICYDFLRRKCMRGDDCRWSHSEWERQKWQRERRQREMAKDADDEENRPRSRSRSPHEEAVDVVREEFWTLPDKVQRWDDAASRGTVKFRAALIQPSGSVSSNPPADGYPLAFFYTPLGEKTVEWMERVNAFSAVAPEPFVLAYPVRPQDHWWFINDSSPWGWIEGEFQPDQVELFESWMVEMVNAPGIDPSRIGLFGYSSGAYAVVELFAKTELKFSGIGLGGVHGHGQSSLENIPKKRKDDRILKIFDAFLDRVKQHEGAHYIEATHSKRDSHCPWEDAQRTFEAINQRQEELGLPEVKVRLAKKKHMEVLPGNRITTQHNYFSYSFLRPAFFSRLFGGPSVEGHEDEDEEDEDEDEASNDETESSPQKSTSKPPAPPAPPPKPPVVPPPTILEVEKYTVAVSCEDWEEKAFEIFEEHGFVLVEKMLKLHQCSTVLKDCEKKTQDRKGKYSCGHVHEKGGILCAHNFAKHLLNSIGTSLLPLLDRIFEKGEEPGYTCVGGGCDFVRNDADAYQALQADIVVKKHQNIKLPPPMLFINFCVQDLTSLNGPPRIIPGTRLMSIDDVPKPEPNKYKRSQLCPVPAGTALIRDARTLHGGTPNHTAKIRFLPSIAFVSKDFRKTNRRDHFPPARCLSPAVYENLSEEMQALCEEIVLMEEEPQQVPEDDDMLDCEHEFQGSDED